MDAITSPITVKTTILKIRFRMVLLIFKLSRHAEGAGPNEVQSEEGGRRRAVLKNRTEEVSASSVLRVKAIEKLAVARFEFLRERLAEAKGKTEPGLSVVAIF